jgi:hypothetical protein
MQDYNPVLQDKQNALCQSRAGAEKEIGVDFYIPFRIKNQKQLCKPDFA